MVHCLFEFMQLAELAIVQVIGSVEDERTFSTLTFMKSKLQNWLVGHLDIAIHMFAQDFFSKETFLFQVVVIDWNDEDKVRIGVNAWLLGFVVLTYILWNCNLLFCIVLLLSQPLISLVMYVVFLYGLEAWSIWSLKIVTCML